MRYVVFDIETQNFFHDVGKNEPALLDVSVVSLYDTDTKKYTTVTVDQLDRIWPIFEQADALVGYNSNHFDIPVLEKYYPGTLTTIKSIDILEDIKNALGKRLKLDSVAEATLGVNKTAAGHQATAWWRQGEIQKIKDYCQADVRITKDVFEYAKKHGYLKYPDMGKKKKIELNIDHWFEDDKSALTHSLGF